MYNLGVINTHALADIGSIINGMPYRICTKLGREEVKPVSKKITMLYHSKAEPMGILKDVLCQVGVTIILARFLILDILVDKDVPIVVGRIFLYTLRNKHEESDEDEEEYIVKRDKNGNPIYCPEFANIDGLKLKFYLHFTLCAEQTGLTLGTHDAEAGSSRPKRSRQHETMEEAMLPTVHHKLLLWGTTTKVAKTKDNTNLARLLPKQIYLPCIVDWGVLNLMGCAEEIEAMFEIKVYEMGGQEELSISSEEELHLSRSLASTIRSPILKVLQKMITYGLCQRTTGYDKVQRNELCLMSMFEAKNQNGYVNVVWLTAKWLQRKGVGSQRDNMICCGQFIMRMERRMGLLTDEVLNGLSALTYDRALDATTLRELIDYT
ncbi:hypothetical protein Tco_1335996 [Tanacetum coccineum]